jgi:16S rRNA (guanine527-N7)-methyltransferase
MNDRDARAWLREHFGVSRETAVAAFAEMVIAESAEQNLISQSTMTTMWLRHIVDSAQLLTMLPSHAGPGRWVDIGTGAGFPGLIVALLTDRQVVLVEPRRKRAAFLASAVVALALGERVSVHASRIEQVDIRGTADVISARAVAHCADLFAAADHISGGKTVWLLPKGINALEEVEAARRTWHGSFHVEQSMTQPGSLVIIATGVSRR